MISPTAKTLTTSNLRDLHNGLVAMGLDQAFRQCVLDCMERPGVEKDRSVTVVIRFGPRLDTKLAVLTSVGVEFNIKTSLPPQITEKYAMVPTPAGALLFEPASPSDPRQWQLPAPGTPGSPAPGSDPAAQETVDPETGEVKPIPRNP